MDKLDRLLDAMGFTPGPWFQAPRNGVYQHDILSESLILIVEGKHKDHDTDHLNTTLMTASRKMLKALIRHALDGIYMEYPELEADISTIESACPWTWEEITKWLEEKDT